MDNHYHLIIETKEKSLQKIMQKVNNAYSKNYNKRHQRTDHVFGGRYKSILVNDDKYLFTLLRYIHANPARAKIHQNMTAEDNNIISVVLWNDQEIDNRKRLTLPVVIMAGGLGTRLYPYTKILPKPLIAIGEIPIAEHIINRFHNHGCDNFFLVINHKKNMIKAYFNEIDKDYVVTYIDEDKPLGVFGIILVKQRVPKKLCTH